MNAPLAAPEDRARHGLPFGEFVGLMAAIISVNALGIDIMLPALGLIGRDLGIAIENHQQFVIVRPPADLFAKSLPVRAF